MLLPLASHSIQRSFFPWLSTQSNVASSPGFRFNLPDASSLVFVSIHRMLPRISDQPDGMGGASNKYDLIDIGSGAVAVFGI